MSTVIFVDKTPDEFRALATGQHRKAEESFERCDTDGFVSQWASDYMGRGYTLAAQVAEAGGTWTFPALLDLTGAMVPARVIRTHYGERWGVFGSWEECSRQGGTVLEWLPVLWGSWESSSQGRARKNLERKGYRQGLVELPGIVVAFSSGTGLAGAATATWYVDSVKGSYGPQAPVVWDGRKETEEPRWAKEEEAG